jgi:hypothetical protein
MGGEVAKFAAVVCSSVDAAAREQATAYIAKVLTDALRGSHGALLAVTLSSRKLNQERFADGVILADPIPLVQTMLAAVQENTATAASLLRSQESLLRGMITSDGVTILGTNGSIRAFRVFVRPSTKGGSGQAASGGARSRAFEVLRACVGKSLAAAMIRSQDGRTEVVVPE